jgi:mRNA interferase RelE/StbE
MTAVDDGGWTLRYSRRAEKDIARLDPPIRRRVLIALGDLAEDPASASGLRKLSGRSESRLRVGDWRVILDVAAGERQLYVQRVLPRGRAYNR